MTTTTTITATSTTTATTETLLSELLASLATGARSVQNLPLGDDFDYQSSFSEFTNLLETTQQDLLDTLKMTIERTALAASVAAVGPTGGSSYNGNSSLLDISESLPDVLTINSLDDPLLWEACTDLCDALLEQAEATIASSSSSSSGEAAGSVGTQQSPTGSHQPKGLRVLQGIIDMEKPQDAYKFGDSRAQMIERQNVFIPPFIQRKYFLKSELDFSITKPGHGIDTKYGESRPRNVSLALSSCTDIIAPSEHIPHVYSDELQCLKESLMVKTDDGREYRQESHSFPPWSFEVSSSPSMKFERTPTTKLLENAIWIDSHDALKDLSELLQKQQISGENGDDGNNAATPTEPFVKEIAIDLEAHSYRSFAGMICLIQISLEVPVEDGHKKDGESSKNRVERKDYFIDPFPVWEHIHDALAPTLANPKVVKVFHGADSDIAWLQRDFGLYVVNMFDTGRAARALQFPSFGFAFLLEKYVDGIEKADKTHQLSDWRQRPLPAAMKEYAILDTHYLLRIYRAMKYELSQSKKTSIQAVLLESLKVCTIRYAPDVFRPNGYKSIMSTQRKGRGGKQTKSRSMTDLTARQEEVLKRLWDWRDHVARQNDESCAYVCSHTALLRIAMGCPTNLSKLQSLLQPMPPLVLRNAKDILNLIQATDSQKPASAMKDRSIVAIEKTTDRKLDNQSAVFSVTEWVSSRGDNASNNIKSDDEVADIVTSCSEEDEDDEGDSERKNRRRTKPRRGVIVHKAKTEFRSQAHSSHRLQLVDDESLTFMDKRRFIDGLAAVRATLVDEADLKEVISDARQSSLQIYSVGLIQGIPGMSCTPITDFMSEGDATLPTKNESGDDEEEKLVAKEEDEFRMPQTVREKYRNSSSWNRTNKKKEAQNSEIVDGQSDMVASNLEQQMTRSIENESGPSADNGVLRAASENNGTTVDAATASKIRSQKKISDYSNIGSIGALATPKAASTAANPFFAGAALQGGYLNKQFASGGGPKKRLRDDGSSTDAGGSGSTKKTPRQQVERPGKQSDGRSQAYRAR